MSANHTNSVGSTQKRMLGDISVAKNIYIACGYTDMLLYKRLENGSFRWPRNESDLKVISWQQFRWLMEGLAIEQKSSILPAKKGAFC